MQSIDTTNNLEIPFPVGDKYFYSYKDKKIERFYAPAIEETMVENVDIDTFDISVDGQLIALCKDNKITLFDTQEKKKYLRSNWL